MFLAAPKVVVAPQAVLSVAGGQGGTREGPPPTEAVAGATGRGGGGAGGRIAIYSFDDLGEPGKNQVEPRPLPGMDLSGGKGHQDGEPGTFFDGTWPGRR